MAASETDGSSSVCGYLTSIEYNQYLEIDFDKERKKIDMKQLIYREIYFW